MWKVTNWCLSVMSQGLKYLKEPNYEVFNIYISQYYSHLEKVVLADPNVDQQDKKSLRTDLMRMVDNLLKDENEEQYKIIFKNRHLEKLAYEMFREFNMKDVQNCIRFFGNLFHIKEDLCTHYVQNLGILDLLKKVFTYCTK